MAKKTKAAPKKVAVQSTPILERTTYLAIHSLIDDGYKTKLEFNVDGAILTLSKDNHNSVDFFIPKLNRTIANRFYCSCSEFDDLNRSKKKKVIKYITIQQSVFICI